MRATKKLNEMCDEIDSDIMIDGQNMSFVVWFIRDGEQIGEAVYHVAGPGGRSNELMDVSMLNEPTQTAAPQEGTARITLTREEDPRPAVERLESEFPDLEFLVKFGDDQQVVVHNDEGQFDMDLTSKVMEAL